MTANYKEVIKGYGGGDLRGTAARPHKDLQEARRGGGDLDPSRLLRHEEGRQSREDGRVRVEPQHPSSRRDLVDMRLPFLQDTRSRTPGVVQGSSVWRHIYRPHLPTH